MTRYFQDLDSAYEFVDRCGWRFEDYLLSREPDGAIKVTLIG